MTLYHDRAGDGVGVPVAPQQRAGGATACKYAVSFDGDDPQVVNITTATGADDTHHEPPVGAQHLGQRQPHHDRATRSARPARTC